MNTRRDKVGDQFEISVNQARRDATVLAVSGEDTLVEYEMPSGTTALRLWEQEKGAWRSVSYRGLPLHWLRRLVAAGVVWVGQQQGKAAPVPPPATVLAEQEQRRAVPRRPRMTRNTRAGGRRALVRTKRG